jgi:8-oxo-dGTP pyrophosphatase MutT (NUDIX family)
MGMAEPEAAVAIVRAQQPISSVLLIRRSERPEDSWSGHWSFPGGRREPADPDLLHTALRELEEECGIHLSREHNEALLSPVLARRRTGPFVLVAPCVFNVDGELPTVVDPEEAVEAVWVPLNLWCNPARHSLRAVPRRPRNCLFPAIDLNGVPIWGFTYRLGTEWLGLLPDDVPVDEAGFAMARRVLDFLLVHGLTLTHDWEDCTSEPTPGNPQTVRLATVEGTIPVELVISHFSAPGEFFPSVNLLEVRPDAIRLEGLAFEEYLISTSSS